MNSEVKILVICPYEGMIPLVRKVAQEFPNVKLNATVGNLNEGFPTRSRALVRSMTTSSPAAARRSTSARLCRFP